MNLYRTTLIFLLNFSIRRFLLLPADCSDINCKGYLTVEPASPFPMGSDLTVYCTHTTPQKCPKNSSSKLSLKLNGQLQEKGVRVNCTTMRFNVVNVFKPESILICMLMTNRPPLVICGLDLQTGFPPDKPTDICCETSRDSDVIACTWNRGQETHILTTYSISVTRDNGSQIHHDGIQSTGEFTLPRKMFDENEEYQLTVAGHNLLGASGSDPFILSVKDVVVPDIPHIKQVEFLNDAVSAMLYWKCSESKEHLRSHIRLRTDNGSLVMVEETEFNKGLIRLEGLKPLTKFEFQIRACKSTPGSILRPTSTAKHISTKRLTSTLRPTSTTKRPLCSRWSPSVWRRSPGKGPSQQLDVWRVLWGDMETNGYRKVTVLWKPLPPEDYSGEVQKYDIILDNGQKQDCPANMTKCLIQMSPGVRVLSVSTVTPYGKSPSATVQLTHSGVPGPVLGELAPAGDCSVVVLSWFWPQARFISGSEEELLGYVVEWTSGPPELHWQRVAKDQNTTNIASLTAGVRYNVSLYAVTTRGVSDPSFGLVYSREEKPLSGPQMSILTHEALRILIRWEGLAVDQQKGFITNYTLYIRTLDPSHKEHRMTVFGSAPRQRWLDCPEGALVLFMTASTSAGEGPQGNSVSSRPTDPAVGLVAGFVFTAILLMVIIANLMCWSCVRKRIKQTCITLGPAWLVENFPKPGNSNVIKLLKEESVAEPPLLSTHSDPPLSPIEEIPQEEREDLYPIVHVEGLLAGPGQSTEEGTSHGTDTGTIPSEGLLVHITYKPQTTPLALQEDGEEEEEMESDGEQTDVPVCEQGDRCSAMSGGLQGDRIANVEVDLNTPSLGLTLSSMSTLLGSNTPRQTNLFYGGVWLGETGSDGEVEMATASLDIQQCETETPDETDSFLSRYMVETTLTNGYFPQVAALNSAHN